MPPSSEKALQSAFQEDAGVFIYRKKSWAAALAEVTNGTLLKINFQQITGGAFEINGSYTYDATKGKEIPETITLSNGAIIKKDVGLYYYKDTDFLEWTFYRRK